jgi:hypothetical protein
MKPSLRIFVLGFLMAGLALAASRAAAQATTIILQYKYATSYDSPAGLQKQLGYLLVETDTDGVYSAGSGPVLCTYDSKAKVAWVVAWNLTLNHDAGRSLVTARTTGVLFNGKTKAVTLKGQYGGFTPFSFPLQHVAPSMQGQELNYVSPDQWYVTRKTTLKLDKARTKHYIEEGDDTMAEAVAHLTRWLEDKGYTVNVL